MIIIKVADTEYVVKNIASYQLYERKNLATLELAVETTRSILGVRLELREVKANSKEQTKIAAESIND